MGTEPGLESRRRVPARSLLLLFVFLSSCGPPVPPSEDPSGPYAGTRLEGAAPDFALSDQTGRSVRLSDLRGKVVVLTFLDSRCRDVCPFTTAELIAAWLGLSEAEQRSVAFVGVNVNGESNSTADVAAASRDWRMDQIPAWSYLTGTPEDLKAVWLAYPVVVLPGPGEAIDHTSGVFILDRDGVQRWYISVPLMDPAWSGPRLAEILLQRLREVLEE